MTAATRVLACREVVGFLGDYVDGRLGPEERAVLDEHLATCPECAAYLRTYADTVRLARAADADAAASTELPDGLVRAILDARGRRPPGARRPRRRR